MPAKESSDERLDAIEARLTRLETAVGHLAGHGDARSNRPAALTTLHAEYEQQVEAQRLRRQFEQAERDLAGRGSR